jgi:ribosomal protein S18 acetylase RimI-like enzyme
VSLEEVCNEEDWQAKEQFHHQTPMGSDGYPCAAHEWTRLERAKCDSGSMRCYFVKLNGDVCGTIGTMDLDGLIRIKNIVVHPTYRRQGIGLETVRAILELARQSGAEEVGVFGIEGAAGSALYERAGFTIGTSQVEWTRSLAGSDH